MPKVLTPKAIENYRVDGIHFPVDVMPAAEAGDLLSRFEAMEARDGGKLSSRNNLKPHLLVPWIAALIRHPRILDAVEDLFGPNLLCWSSAFFAKNARDSAFVSWHQDSTYWGLSSTDVVTAWIALTPSRVENGCMRIVPGTHKAQVAHADTFGETNLLSRGQEIAVEVDESEAVDVVLEPGQMSLHHVMLFHGSEPNPADYRRVGLAVRYIPTSVSQVGGNRNSASLVRGVDEFGHFDHEPRPESEFHPDAVARHAAFLDRHLSIQYAGAMKRGSR